MSDIVYVMNVDWNWIKQRPHFIAERLQGKYYVHVMYQHRYGREGFQKRVPDKIDVKPIYVIPRGDRFALGSKINRWIKNRSIISAINRTKAKYLYLTFPDQAGAIPNDFKGAVIYDCMDNHPAFIDDYKKRNEMISMEKQMVTRANIILASSENLISVLLDRFGNIINNKIHLIRNGYNGSIVDVQETIPLKVLDKFTFTYLGTVSSWFNFDYIIKSLEDFPSIQYEIFGPVARVSIPKHDRVIYRGTVEHDQLLQNVKDSDCLIMPFMVNEIIESVDPVKLYEYINFNKNILCCEYKEIRRFEPFVNFYSDYSSYRTCIQNLLDSRGKIKYSQKNRNEFLIDNNWDARVDDVERLIESGGV